MFFISQLDTGRRSLQRFRPILVSTILVLLGSVPSADAISMRCGNSLVSDGKIPGASMAEVVDKCGEPYDTYGDQWLYVRGDSVYRVYFTSEGNVRRITTEIVR